MKKQIEIKIGFGTNFLQGILSVKWIDLVLNFAELRAERYKAALPSYVSLSF
jgi:hypothetical protein